MIALKIIPSTEKCRMTDSIESKKALTSVSMLKNERLSFQLCYTDTDPNQQTQELGLLVESPIRDKISIYRVEQVPVRIACYRGRGDDDFIDKEPGLYPDLLMPLDEKYRFLFIGGELRSLLFEVHDPNGIAAGTYPIRICAMRGGEALLEATLTLEVIGASLPEQDLIYTCWFHSDCLAQYYRVPVFSEEYWRIVRNFVAAAVRDGQNMLLTPVFTPPLDTAVGHERLTVQLVDVTLTEAGEYRFGFDNLDRFVSMALEEGIRYFEISHLFTQWGCAHAPKIMATTPDGYRQLWGWETDAHSTEYKTFLRAFLTAFLAHAKELGIDKQCHFHISDEPSIDHLDAYLDAKNAISDLLAGYPLMDALSSFEFYRTGAVETPIPANNHIEPFLEAGVPNLWTYYCCSQGQKVSNRFLAMPGYRTRVLGAQLFKFRIAGFLHWGFNFYNSVGSLYPINPYEEANGDYFFPAGNGFVVYPAPDGSAYPTLHGRQFAEALTDLRALRLCAEKIGFERTLALVEEGCDEALTFSSYPKSHDYLLTLREKVNRAIAQVL